MRSRTAIDASVTPDVPSFWRTRWLVIPAGSHFARQSIHRRAASRNLLSPVIRYASAVRARCALAMRAVE